ncbi:MAG: glycosyltransferase family 1 protein [Ferruginibacter sp.]
MNTPIKIALDGTLFSECYLRGANRDGMMRLTEDITDQLILKDDLDISFVNNLSIAKYNRSLKNFIQEHYPDHLKKVLTKNPLFFTDIVAYKEHFRTKLSSFSFSPYYKEINHFDIFHSFYYPFAKSILKNKVKRSITYLDIIALKLNGYPDYLVNRTKEIVDCIAGNFAISISEFSRQDLLEYDNKIDPAKVFVVPLAASSQLFYQSKNKEDWEVVKEKYNLPDHYFLSVTGNDKRKNIAHLIKAFNQFILQEKSADIDLVLTGNGAHNRAMLEELNISKEVQKRIFIPERFIDSEDLAVLYSNAVSFFFMSYYEGFGLPALEAMQCGVPVVAADNTSLPEVVGEAGILISPYDADRLSEEMRRLYNDEQLRNRLAEASLIRSSEFSWKRCANEYADIFKKIKSDFN